jgi:hypothetical protein
MDLIYVVPEIDSLPGVAIENPHTSQSLASDLVAHPIPPPLLTDEERILRLQPEEPVFGKFVAELRVVLHEIDDETVHFDNGAEAVFLPRSARELAAAARVAQGIYDEDDSGDDEMLLTSTKQGGQYSNTKITRKLKTYRSKKQSKKNKAKKQSRKRLHVFK